MPCPRTLLLSACLDPECTGRRRALILAHVRSCPVCAGELDALQCLSDELRALPDPAGTAEMLPVWQEHPAAGRYRLLDRLSGWLGSFGWTSLPAGLAVAASLVAGIGLANWPLPVDGPAQFPASVARLDVFGPEPPGGLCAGSVCGNSRERT